MVNYSEGKVYMIVNDANSMIYVGSTTQSLAKRFSVHRSNAKTNREPGNRLHNAMRSYGENRFRIVLIETVSCASKVELEREEYRIMQQFERSRLYNTRIGHEYSPEIGERMSAAKRDKREQHELAWNTLLTEARREMAERKAAAAAQTQPSDTQESETDPEQPEKMTPAERNEQARHAKEWEALVAQARRERAERKAATAHTQTDDHEPELEPDQPEKMHYVRCDDQYELELATALFAATRRRRAELKAAAAQTHEPEPVACAS